MSPFFQAPFKVASLLCGVALIALAPLGAVSAAPPQNAGSLGDMQEGGEELFKQIVPSVIQVFTGGSAGSGYFIDKGGYAITNRHVSGTQTNYEITLYKTMGERTHYKAIKIGTDPALDMALLKVEAPDDLIVPIKLADTSKMKVGDVVATCGSPGGSAGATNVSDGRDGWLDYFNFCMGMLTEIIPMDRCLIVFGQLQQTEMYADLYQLDYGSAVQYLFHVDAAINHGNSGGPAVNERGEAIGTNTWGFGGENLGMSVPVNLLTRSAREILQYGRVRRAWLGIGLHEASPNPSQQKQVERGLSELAEVSIDPTPDEIIVRQLNNYAPAAEYLRIGDKILSVDGKHYDNIFEIYSYILDHHPGDKVTLQIERNGVGLPPMTIELAEKKNRFNNVHVYAEGNMWGVGSAGQTGIGGGVVTTTY